MRMTTPMAWLFDYPVDDILAQLPEEDDPLWDGFDVRQNRFPAHRVTRTIPILWEEDVQEGVRPEVEAVRMAAPRLYDAAMVCAARIAEDRRGTAVRVLLTELPAGGRIPRHVDKGEMLDATHRCHMAVITNPGVRFEVGRQVFHPAAGKVYEFDNMRRHAVVNLGNTRRVHLICNVFPASA
jgi:hypothetical protein